jgi:hypothetical protein
VTVLILCILWALVPTTGYLLHKRTGSAADRLVPSMAICSAMALAGFAYLTYAFPNPQLKLPPLPPRDATAIVYYVDVQFQSLVIGAVMFACFALAIIPIARHFPRWPQALSFVLFWLQHLAIGAGFIPRLASWISHSPPPISFMPNSTLPRVFWLDVVSGQLGFLAALLTLLALPISLWCRLRKRRTDAL